MKDYLRSLGMNELMASRDSTRAAFAAELIIDGEAWMNMILSRNLSSHTYNLDIAANLASKLCPSMRLCSVNLRKKCWRCKRVIALEGDEIANSVTEPTFGLTPRAMKLLRDLFAANPRIERAIVYGSRAKGNYRNGSDIDMALDAPSMDFDVFLRLCTAVDDLMLPWNVDLSLLSHIDNPALLEHIARVGKPLWTKKE